MNKVVEAGEVHIT